jgi:hypothetical protein
MLGTVGDHPKPAVGATLTRMLWATVVDSPLESVTVSETFLTPPEEKLVLASAVVAPKLQLYDEIVAPLVVALALAVNAIVWLTSGTLGDQLKSAVGTLALAVPDKARNDRKTTTTLDRKAARRAMVMATLRESWHQ